MLSRDGEVKCIVGSGVVPQAPRGQLTAALRAHLLESVRGTPREVNRPAPRDLLEELVALELAAHGVQDEVANRPALLRPDLANRRPASLTDVLRRHTTRLRALDHCPARQLMSG